MRRYVAVGAILAFAFGGLNTAKAQGRSGSGDSDPFSFHLGPIAEGTDIRIEVDSISTRGGPDPSNTDQANHNIDYKARHVFAGFAMGIHIEPPALAGFELDADFLLGSMSTALSENIHNMSVHEPGPGNDEEHNTALDEADLAVGIQLRAWYRLQQVRQFRLWAAAEYQFISGWAHFNDERFFDDDIEGDYSFSRHRLTFFVGTRIGIIRPVLGVWLPHL